MFRKIVLVSVVQHNKEHLYLYNIQMGILIITRCYITKGRLGKLREYIV